MKFNEILYTPEFQKDLKKLKKRFKTLEDDLGTLINAGIALFHKQRLETGGIVRISGLGIQQPGVYKARKVACRFPKGTASKSGIRVVYAYYEEEDKLLFIEIYYKGDKENEDRDRIIRVLL